MVKILFGGNNIELLESIRDTRFMTSSESFIICDGDSKVDVGVMNIALTDNIIILKTIEIYPHYRYRGYGTQTILELFELFQHADYITGIVFDEAVDFYKKLEGCVVEQYSATPVQFIDGMFKFTISRLDN